MRKRRCAKLNRQELLLFSNQFGTLVTIAPRRFSVRPQLSNSRNGSVSQDWRTPLSKDKSHAYVRILHRLETSYAMFSINLDEALGLRTDGRIAKAQQVLSVSSALCQRLSAPLVSLLRAMLRHARHSSTAPNLASLDPQNFQNSRSQRVARFNNVLSKVLLTRRSQFLHKISTLTELVEELTDKFEASSEEIFEGDPVHPDGDWEVLDGCHYDLNTCLRETIVLFKSFLHALPENQLQEFLSTVQEQTASTEGRTPARAHYLVHRRMAAIKGQ